MGVTRREFVELAVAGAVAQAAPALAKTKTPLGKRPNILLMLGDDHRWNVLGCMGDPVVHTPNLDKLSSEGATFENHFCTTPICCASRASIMLGQYAATTGIYDFTTPLSSEQVKRTYWGQLKQAGYSIGFVGKFGVGSTMPSGAFDYWRGFPGQGNYFPDGPDGPHLMDILRDQAEEYFRQVPNDRPFCLSISFKSPHVQDQSPKQYLPKPSTLSLYKGMTMPPISRAGTGDIERFPLAIQHSESRHRWGVRFATPAIYQESIKGYYRLVSGIDETVGSLRQTLAKLGLAENTIIIYSADHGIFNGEHGLAGKWYGQEESIRIPLIIYDPRLPSSLRGKRKQAMSLNIDLCPTVLDLAGFDTPESVEGRSLKKLLDADDPDFRPLFFVEHHFPYRGWIPSSEGIRTRRWKYLRYTDNAAPYKELYDLKTDRFETNNLIGKPAFSRQQNALANYWLTWQKSLHRNSGRWTEPVTRENLVRDGLV